MVREETTAIGVYYRVLKCFGFVEHMSEERLSEEYETGVEGRRTIYRLVLHGVKKACNAPHTETVVLPL